MIYIVLGMHKSGTTLVAQLLHASGINMVEDEDDISYDTGNKCERRLTKDLNKEMLGTTGLVRFTDELLRAPLAVSPGTRARMVALISALNAQHVDWGFKDPRTCLTYGAWSDHLPSHRLVFVYRSYAELLQRFNGGIRQLQLAKMRRVLYAWTHYNSHCIAHLKAAKVPGLIINYEALMSEQREMARLIEFLGRDITDVRRQSLRRNEAANRYRSSWFAGLVGHSLPERPARVLATLDGLRQEQCTDAARAD